jgi:hypothetical protein
MTNTKTMDFTYTKKKTRYKANRYRLKANNIVYGRRSTKLKPNSKVVLDTKTMAEIADDFKKFGVYSRITQFDNGGKYVIFDDPSLKTTQILRCRTTEKDHRRIYTYINPDSVTSIVRTQIRSPSMAVVPKKIAYVYFDAATDIKILKKIHQTAPYIVGIGFKFVQRDHAKRIAKLTKIVGKLTGGCSSQLYKEFGYLSDDMKVNCYLEFVINWKQIIKSPIYLKKRVVRENVKQKKVLGEIVEWWLYPKPSTYTFEKYKTDNGDSDEDDNDNDADNATDDDTATDDDSDNDDIDDDDSDNDDKMKIGS